jgi:ketosteroid isomerase-like protein
MKLLKLLLGLGSALVLAACVQKPAKGPDTSAADAAVIRANVEAFVSAWNKGDTASLRPMLADDAILMQPAGPAVSGGDAIVQAIAKGYDIATTQQMATVDEIIVNGGQAYAHGTWKLSPTEAAGPDVKARNGKWSALYKRDAEGVWQNWRWMWNEDAAPPPAPATT